VTYEPLQLNTPALLDTFWPKVSPMLERVANEAVKGEWDMEHLTQLISAQKVVLFVVTDDKTGGPDADVQLVLAVEPIYYPKLATLNVLALAGKGVRKHGKTFWKHFTGWAYISGFKAIDGWVSPGMARMTSALGFKPVYTHVRYDLSENSGG